MESCSGDICNSDIKYIERVSWKRKLATSLGDGDCLRVAYEILLNRDSDAEEISLRTGLSIASVRHCLKELQEKSSLTAEEA